MTLPCGCETALRASEDSDPIAREALAQPADEQRQDWQCPCAGYPLRDSPDHLGERARAALVNVEKLTGAGGFATCPLFYLRRGHLLGEAIERVTIARHWRDKGSLEAVEGPCPRADLIEAVTLVDRAVAKREAHELKLAREQNSKPPSQSNINNQCGFED